MFTLMDSASAASRWVRNIVNPKAEPKAPETVRRIRVSNSTTGITTNPVRNDPYKNFKFRSQ